MIAPTISPEAFGERLLTAPHVLIAGQTGSGKSTALDTIIYSMSGRRPKEMTAFVIDLKRVSVAQWKPIPHIRRYVTEPGECISALESVCVKMDDRYRQMEMLGIREWQGSDLYLIVDECADLLDTVKGSYDYLKKIARLGRAAHIHLILCTQSPSRKVIPSDLTLNITHKVGLRCDSAIESRQVINAKGCEDLPMYGYGLLRCPQEREPVLCEIHKIDDREINRVVEYWKGF